MLNIPHAFNILVNGEPRSVTVKTIPELLSHEQVPQDHWQSIAIARNGHVIPRSEWDQTTVHDGDVMDIVKPFVGG